MPVSDERRKYLNEYHKTKVKRVPLDLPLEDYETLKAAAASINEPINAFIKKAIKARIEDLR